MMSDVLADKTAPIHQLIDAKKVSELVNTRGETYKTPWFGQLMTGPQLIAYLLQINFWLKNYNVKIEL